MAKTKKRTFGKKSKKWNLVNDLRVVTLKGLGRDKKELKNAITILENKSRDAFGKRAREEAERKKKRRRPPAKRKNFSRSSENADEFIEKKNEVLISDKKGTPLKIVKAPRVVQIN